MRACPTRALEKHFQGLDFLKKKDQQAEGSEPDPVDTEAQVADDTDPDPKPRKNESIHYGDPGYNEYLDDPDEEVIQSTSWKEVATKCCCHSPKEWGGIGINIIFICICLYFFIFSLELLGTGAKVLTGCAAAGLFGDNTNPVAALIIGMLVTVLLQSSSTTTSIIVSLVGSNAITVEPAIYMVMGANIGTSVTNTIVAMGEMGNGEELERAFAGATVHDMFNFLSVLVFFPLEIISGMLAALTEACTRNYSPDPDGEKRKSGRPCSLKVSFSIRQMLTIFFFVHRYQGYHCTTARSAHQLKLKGHQPGCNKRKDMRRFLSYRVQSCRNCKLRGMRHERKGWSHHMLQGNRHLPRLL